MACSSFRYLVLTVAAAGVLGCATSTLAQDDVTERLDALLRLLDAQQATTPPPSSSSEANEDVARLARRLETVEDRVATLEEQLSRLLNQGVPDGRSPTAASEGMRNEALTPGAVLQFYLMPSADPAVLAVPPALATATMIDEGPLFRFDAFTKEPDMAVYAGRPIGLRWTGFWEVLESSTHLLDLVVETRQHRASSASASGAWTDYPRCRSYLKVEDQEIVRLSLGDGRASTPFSGRLTVLDGVFPEPRTVDLEHGYHRFEFWLACSSLRPDTITATLRMKGRADVTPRTVSSENLFYLR